MPGHKGNVDTGFFGEVLRYDITEIDGMDNLHDANGVILGSERYAASLYGSQVTHFLTGGSTVGILSAIAGVTKPGDEILTGRNCHRSVYNAAEINRLKTRYLYPEYLDKYDICGGISAKDVESALKEYPDVRAVVITSPTYEGICSDVRAIAEITHKHGKILIVDAAHGAHFGFGNGFPESAVTQGADIVIHSVHKTLPALTQTALIHLNCSLKDREAVERMLKIYQSSSPSYLLMAGIDNCMSIIGEKGKELFDGFFERLCSCEKELKDLKRLKLINRDLLRDEYGIFDADPGKLIISVRGSSITGRELYDMLRYDHNIQPEMAAGSYCLLIMSIMDTEEGFERIKNALKCIDEKVSTGKNTLNISDLGRLYVKAAYQALPAYQTAGANRQIVDLNKAAGSVSAEYICLYPPGIPILVPGEEITADHVTGIRKAVDKGLTVQGLKEEGKKITICDVKSVL